MADLPTFRYSAIDGRGRRVKGVVAGADAAVAFDRLRREGLTPLELRRATVKTGRAAGAVLSDREAADFLASLSDLLVAGADIRTALGILAARFERPAVRAVCAGLVDDISGGDSPEAAFERAFAKRHAFVGPIVAAAQAAGDLSGGLQRSAEILQSRMKLREQLVSVLAYPTFVFISSIGAVLAILLFIVPTIAPLTEEIGGEPPAALAAMIFASNLLTGNLVPIAIGLAALILLIGLAARAGLLTEPMQRLLLDGPFRRTAAGLIFGGFALSLGTMLAAGASISEALRLAIHSAPNGAARRRLEPVARAVRDGHTLSDALAEVKGFPNAIVRLAAVGEASNAVGRLLVRGGRLEEQGALQRIETAGRVLGPALIILLGGLLGVLMGGLLSGVSQMGQSVMG